MASRRKSRILAFQALYAWEVSGPACAADLLEFPWVDEDKRGNLDAEALAFGRLLFSGCVESLGEVDQAIRASLVNWDMERLSRVDLAILRLSSYCLLFQRDIPSSVTIDEAVELAKEFGAPDSFRFVNGVLDGIRKSFDKAAQAAGAGS